jgi:NAD(P)-dependent dehydrogenase (short-subunit alcohol dehydrogenase family)
MRLGFGPGKGGCRSGGARQHLSQNVYDDARNVLESNLLSAFLVMKHFAPLMPETGGSFVCVSSRLGMVGTSGQVLLFRRQGWSHHAGQGCGDRMGPAQHPCQRRRSGPDRHPVISCWASPPARS